MRYVIVVHICDDCGADLSDENPRRKRCEPCRKSLDVQKQREKPVTDHRRRYKALHERMRRGTITREQMQEELASR